MRRTKSYGERAPELLTQRGAKSKNRVGGSADEQVFAARKSLGQHWLTDDKTLDSICNLAELKPTDTVLEIGPGTGSLTKKLVAGAGQVVAVELDKKLTTQLSERTDLSHNENLRVVQEDILRFDLTSLPRGYKVVANIPYYLTNNLLRILCEAANPPSKMVLLVQKEVADRVAAQPGEMSLLSVSVQFYCEVKLGPVVPAKLFTPAPKVDSQVLVLDYRIKPLFADVDTKRFFGLVKAGFAQKRKTLLNTLSVGLKLDKQTTAELLKRAQIDPQTRAQELSLKNWYQLYLALK